jgi:glutaryl-CoA dehydrogenase (non-decarboxylating)
MTADPNSRAEFGAFVGAEIAPRAAQFDRDQKIPRDLIQTIADRGFLTPWLPAEYGGQGMDMVTYGRLTEEFGATCAASRGVLTVVGMVAQTILRCGNPKQKRELLPALAQGKKMAAVAITEPNVGSNASKPEVAATPNAEGYKINGRKCWISFGQLADVFLLLADCKGKPTAFLIPRDTPGLTITPVNGLMGMRGAMLADLEFRGCEIPDTARIGVKGAGFSLVMSTALDHGRYSIAWGSTGVIRACLEQSTVYTDQRRQFGKELRQHQLIKRIITNMLTDLRCAELLCVKCGELRNEGAPTASAETMIAKYFASVAANRAAGDAVQVLGANGYSDRYPVERYYRDAKALEIIEGSSQIQQMTLADYAYRQYPGP